MPGPGAARPDALPSGASPAAAWPRIAVFGAGAVGCFHGARFAEAGAPVRLIGRPAHVDAIRRDGLLFEIAGGGSRRIAIDAGTDEDAVADADLVLFCVKTRDTAASAASLAARMRPGAVLVSLQNGVENVPLIRSAGLDPLAAVVYVAVSMPGPGHLRHAGRGDLVLGEFGPPPPGVVRMPDRAERIAALFERAGVPCPVGRDVRADLWVKLVMNCVMNPVSALGRTRYGRMIEDAPTRGLIRAVIDECVAVARAEGIALPAPERLYDDVLRLGEAMREASSSTAQDLAAGRPTEIDALNGYVARRAQALGVPAPVNQALYALVGLLEAAPAGR